MNVYRSHKPDMHPDHTWGLAGFVSYLWVQLKCLDSVQSSQCRKACVSAQMLSLIHDTWQLVRLACSPSLPTRRRRSSGTSGPPPTAGDWPSSSSSSAAATESSCSRACISSSRNIPSMLTSSFADTWQFHSSLFTCVIFHHATSEVSANCNCHINWKIMTDFNLNFNLKIGTTVTANKTSSAHFWTRRVRPRCKHKFHGGGVFLTGDTLGGSR